MKKAAVILLLSIYSLATFGIGVQQFYCCGILKSTAITLIENSKEKKCGKDNEKTGCCKTVFKSFKVKDNHLPGEIIHFIQKHFPEAIIYNSVFISLQPAQQPVAGNPSHAPPLYEGAHLYIYYCVYRI